jgi:RNA polymerase sigma factor (sigma-70 family)
MTPLTAANTEQLEREFIAHRDAVLSMLRAEFRGLEDPEGLYQEAWAEALELLESGETIRRPRGLLKTIARRRAMDELRNRHTVSIDPASQLIVGRPDQAIPVDELAASQLDSVTLRQIIDDLDPRQAAVIKLRFDEHRTADEIRERLGITQKRLEKIVKAAYERVLSDVDASASGESRWRRRQRSLLLNCEVGWATAAQRARAQRMVDEDPVCRAMLREMRAALRDVAALLPVPVFVQEDRIARIPATLWDRVAITREHLSDLLSRAPAHAQTIEQAGAGLTGAAGMGVAAKVALVCAFTAGGTVACVETGLFGGSAPTRPHEAHTTATRTTPPKEPKPPVVAATTRKTTTQPKRATRRSTSGGGSRSASAPPAPSPVRAGTEFGPGAIGSQSASTQPAAAPSGGGGEFLP